jgi:hypothetical protein
LPGWYCHSDRGRPTQSTVHRYKKEEEKERVDLTKIKK